MLTKLRMVRQQDKDGEATGDGAQVPKPAATPTDGDKAPPSTPLHSPSKSGGVVNTNLGQLALLLLGYQA